MTAVPLPAMMPVKSSNLAVAGHGDLGLFVRFKPHGDKPGDVWLYRGVPLDHYTALISAPSPGKYLNQFIKAEPTLYPAEKVDG